MTSPSLPDYDAFARRVLRAYARRVGHGDVEALALMLGLDEEIDTAIAEAVKDLRGRLLLGQDRLPARHHSPGRTATMKRRTIWPIALSGIVALAP